MIINLIDPALRLTAGHHLDLGLGVVRELHRAGHDVHVYCHAGISADAAGIVAAHAPLTPAFSVTPYADEYGATRWHDQLSTFSAIAHTVADDLHRVRRADAWLWPSIFASQAYACALANPGVPIAGCVHVEPEYMSSAGPDLWRHALAEAARAGAQVGLGAFEQMLCDQYRLLTPTGKFAKLPIPYDRCRVRDPRARMTTVGFFGAQRDEKGVFLIQNLVPALLDSGLNIVLHDSSGGSSGSSDARFRMIFGYVEDLAVEIASCDLVVTPYNPEAYRTKGSAIVWSALANGVPVVAPRDTASGALIEQSGAGTTFGEYSAPSVLAAVLEARNNYPAIAQRAREASDRWVKEHGNQHYVDAMLKALGKPD